MTDPFGAILRSNFLAPDWTALRQSPPQEAAARLKAILCDLEHFEKQVFALRGMAMLVIEERQLWTQFIDPEVDRPYASFDRWLKATLPNSWGYARDALRAVKELRDVPFVDLLEMPRSNIETLKKVSTSVRKEPKVIEAAKTQTETQFTETLSRQFDQHLQISRTFKATYSAGEYAEVEGFLLRVCKRLDIEPDMGAALLALAIDDRIEHEEEDAA